MKVKHLLAVLLLATSVTAQDVKAQQSEAMATLFRQTALIRQGITLLQAKSDALEELVEIDDKLIMAILQYEPPEKVKRLSSLKVQKARDVDKIGEQIKKFQEKVRAENAQESK